MAGSRKAEDGSASREKTPRPARSARIERVQKRDGREVPFAVEKIQAAITAAMEAVGERDVSFAAEVAYVVELTLAERLSHRRQAESEAEPQAPPRAPHIEEIQDLVEKALMELGRPNVAKAYILYRDQRARIREALRVHAVEPWSGARPRVREADGVAEWSKGKIVAALMEEAELPRVTAEEVAAAVERRVFTSRLKRVTTGLVRELVTSELFERGLSRALARQSRLGLSRRDVRAALRGQPLQPWSEPAEGAPPREASRVVGEELLRRHVLEDVLDEGLAELHHAGDLHFEGLGRTHAPLSLALEADLLAPGGAAPSQAHELLDAVAELAGEVARALVLERPAEVLEPLAASRRLGRPSALGAWLHALAAVARAAGVRVDLGSSGVERAEFTAGLLAELADLVPAPGAPGLFLEARELEEVLRAAPELAPAAERLLVEGRLALAWSDGEERVVAPGCRRRAGERGVVACAAAVALNLPRLARRAGPQHEELVQRGLAELVQAAVESARALARFRAGCALPRARGLSARFSFAIVPVGLREALAVLGDGEIDPDQGARLLGLLAEAAGRFAEGGVVASAPSPFFGESAAARFAWLDRISPAGARSQAWLFAEAGGAEEPAVYSSALSLTPLPAAPPGAAEARLLRTVSSGVHMRLSLPPATDPEATPQLDAWRRFEVQRRRDRGERSLELFPAAAAPRPATPRRTPLRPLT